MPTPSVSPVSPVPPPRPLPAVVRKSRNGGLIAVAVAAGVVLLLGLIGVPISLYALQQHGPGDGGRDPLTGSTTSAPAVSGPTYDVKKVPENLCGVVDLSALAEVFEGDDDKPEAHRDANEYFTTATCIVSRDHSVRGVPESVGTLGLSVHVFANPASATRSHQKSREDAQRNTTALADLPDFGTDGYIYPKKNNTAKPGLDASFELELQDGNMLWSVSLTGSRVDDKDWTDKQREDLRARLITAAKASYAKVVAVLK